MSTTRRLEGGREGKGGGREGRRERGGRKGGRERGKRESVGGREVEEGEEEGGRDQSSEGEVGRKGGNMNPSLIKLHVYMYTTCRERERKEAR